MTFCRWQYSLDTSEENKQFVAVEHHAWLQQNHWLVHSKFSLSKSKEISNQVLMINITKSLLIDDVKLNLKQL